jgi:hypothetical protein
MMDANELSLAVVFRKDACSNLRKHLPRIVRCLELLSDRDIWWRPNTASNSAGNIVLHLCGNVRQWIISGLGGAPDMRDRDSEFAERGPIPRRALITQLKKTIDEASKIIEGAAPEILLREFSIQGYRVSGLVAIAHVSEHFSYHAGQIIYVTKLKRGTDLRFTRLPATKPVRKRGAAARP